MSCRSLRSPESDTSEPLLLHFRRAPSSSMMHCYRMSTEAPSPLLPQAVPFLDIRQAGPSTIFTYANSKESWAIVTHSAELGVDVLDAPSLGLLQIPLSTYLDDMTSLFPGSGGAYSMRTRYGCQKWFRLLGDDSTRVVLKASHPPQSEEQTESVVSALTLIAQETSTYTNRFQAAHFLPSDADPNLFAKWPFFFNITAVYHTRDEVALEIILSNLPSSPLLVREASINLIHAAVLAVFVINKTIWSH